MNRTFNEWGDDGCPHADWWLVFRGRANALCLLRMQATLQGCAVRISLSLAILACAWSKYWAI